MGNGESLHRAFPFPVESIDPAPNEFSNPIKTSPGVLIDSPQRVISIFPDRERRPRADRSRETRRARKSCRRSPSTSRGGSERRLRENLGCLGTMPGNGRRERSAGTSSRMSRPSRRSVHVTERGSAPGRESRRRPPPPAERRFSRRRVSAISCDFYGFLETVRARAPVAGASGGERSNRPGAPRFAPIDKSAEGAAASGFYAGFLRAALDRRDTRRLVRRIRRSSRVNVFN